MHSFRRRNQTLVSLDGCWLVLQRPQNRYGGVRDSYRSGGHRSEVGVGFGVQRGVAIGVAAGGQGAQCSTGPSRRIPSFALMAFSTCACFPRRLLTVMMIPVPLLVLVVKLEIKVSLKVGIPFRLGFGWIQHVVTDATCHPKRSNSGPHKYNASAHDYLCVSNDWTRRAACA